MRLVVFDEVDGLCLGRAQEPEAHPDALKDGRVRATTDPFDAGLDPIEANPSVPRAALHQQYPAGGNACQERFRRGDLLTRPAEVRRFVDHELVVADLVDGAPRGRRAAGPNPVNHEILTGHPSLLSRPRCRLRLDTCKKSVEVDHDALVGSAGDQLDVIEGHDLEVDATPFSSDDASRDAHPHANRRRFEMLDGQAGSDSCLTWVELLDDGQNRCRLEPVAENRRRQNRHAGILEPIGAMLREDDLFEASLLAHTDRFHQRHFTVKQRPAEPVAAGRRVFEIASMLAAGRAAGVTWTGAVWLR